ncbi:Long-chain-alcohol oxidase FAO3 [Neolecta irregularis DAH-3]|uniref:Long-chain-alcohol oxidase n=1 Tax=Neolecta irregularis (strain DAH-3) TaxID=1198029 RepID=A0A1U7LV20_NEOID|nr:Long-chain-alcohol oxidase FAO3 [Neolecta irregularis DAH-3]|eukprot:OLL26423.1 Long-chain-alcohol oxidase FAO3 [Neolecta irregularis DAH-3]
MAAPLYHSDPTIKPTSIFSPEQWETLLAICDTFIAPLGQDEIQKLLQETHSNAVKERKELVVAFLQEKATDYPGFKEKLDRILSNNIQPSKLRQIRFVLSLLSSRFGAVLTGHITPIHQLNRAQRECVLQSWTKSPLLSLRTLFSSLSRLSRLGYISCSEVAMQAIGYPLTDPDSNHPTRFQAKRFHDFMFLDIKGETAELHTEVVIVGSGSGGGVVAAILAKAGRKMIVIEKGKYHPQETLPLSETEAKENLFEAGGALMSDDGCVSILAGSTWGGGSAINWSTSLQPQSYVRDEWAREYPFFNELAFQESLDFVCKRMGCSTKHMKHNKMNHALIEGSRKLGFPYCDNPQNTGDAEHSCGYCGYAQLAIILQTSRYGCRYAEKQSSNVSWLVDAASNAQFLQKTHVEKVIMKGNRAIGVEALVNGQTKLRVFADVVVLAGGAINTPAVLLRSAVKNKNIGKNLTLHPVSTVFGHYYDEDTKPWEGAILTASSQISERRVLGWGAKLEVQWNIPGLAALNAPWRSGYQVKRNMLYWNQSVAYSSRARERDPGYVYIDKQNKLPRICYTLSSFDCDSILDGVLRLCDIVVTAGANEVFTGCLDVEIYKTTERGIADPSYKNWKESVRTAGIIPGRSTIGSAHQMSSCRMGKDPRNSVVDDHGRVHGYQRLYIADSSVLPSASGVNPMISTMGLAHYISLKLIEDMKSMNALSSL